MTSLTHAHTHHDWLEAADEEAEAAALLDERVARGASFRLLECHVLLVDVLQRALQPRVYVRARLACKTMTWHR